MLPKIHLTIERWRKNKEYGVYVSTCGRVKLIKNKELLNPRINERGYCIVFTDKGAVQVHRLVAYTWLGGKRNAMYNVDHINSNKRDNSIKNLRWVTIEVNNQYAQYTQTNIVPAATEVVEETPIEKIEDEFTILYSKEVSINDKIKVFEQLYKEKRLYLKYNGQAIVEYLQLFDIKFPGNKPRKNVFLEKVINACINRQEYGGYKWELIKK